MEAKKGLQNEQYELSLYEAHFVQLVLLILYAPAVLVMLYGSEVLYVRLLPWEGIAISWDQVWCFWGCFLGVLWHVEFQRSFW